jgi:hypothetical protein
MAARLAASQEGLSSVHKEVSMSVPVDLKLSGY